MQEFPFTTGKINSIFKVSSINSNRITSRESSTLEFKESFGWNSLSLYMKTCVAFANNKGGYIVFGVKNNPRDLCGLSPDSLERFKSIDEEKITGEFNRHFAPEIKWTLNEYEYKEKIFGMLYIYESLNKPVICKSNKGKQLKEGDIFYRYRGRSERIKYSELVFLLEENRKKEQLLWMNHLKMISKIGVQDTGIFSLKDGIVSGITNSFIIDESIISSLRFIKEGSFNATDGEPTLRLIGDVRKINTTDSIPFDGKIIKTKGISLGDIVLGFLKEDKIEEPLDYIRQICLEQTSYLPVYYYIKLSKMSINEIIDIIDNVITRIRTKERLKERLSVKKSLKLTYSKNYTKASKIKGEYLNLLMNSMKIEIMDLEKKELVYYLQTIRMLPVELIKESSKEIRKQLREVFNNYYVNGDSGLVDNLRKTICWIDEVLYNIY